MHTQTCKIGNDKQIDRQPCMEGSRVRTSAWLPVIQRTIILVIPVSDAVATKCQITTPPKTFQCKGDVKKFWLKIQEGHLWWNIRTELGKNPIYYSYKKNKVPRNKLNKVVKKTTEHWRKKLRKIQINGSTYCVCGLEELTTLKCAHYLKQPIDSTQSLLR